MVNILKSKQIIAIRNSVKLGRILQKDLGEKIIELYINGHSLYNIVEELNFQSRYDVNKNIAKNGIHYAICGYNGDNRIKKYNGLINKKERKKIADEHIVENGCNLGYKSYKLRVGVHGRNTEQMIEDGRKSAIARGQILWTDEEKEFAYALSQKSDYQRGGLTLQNNNKKITQILNDVYHKGKEVRSVTAVGIELKRIKIKIQQKTL